MKGWEDGWCSIQIGRGKSLMAPIEAPNPMFKQDGTTQPYHGPTCAGIFGAESLPTNIGKLESVNKRLEHNKRKYGIDQLHASKPQESC